MFPSSIFSCLRASHSGFKYCKRMMIFEQKSFIGLFGSLLDLFFFLTKLASVNHKVIKGCHTLPVLQCFLPFNITLPAILSWVSTVLPSPFSSLLSLFFLFTSCWPTLLPKIKLKLKASLKKHAWKKITATTKIHTAPIFCALHHLSRLLQGRALPCASPATAEPRSWPSPSAPSNVVLTPAAGQLPPGFRMLLEQQILGALGVNGRAVVAGVLQGRPLG